MNFKDLREANLSKAQINKVHDKADDLPKSDFIKRYGKEGDAVRFATATNMVKKQLGIAEAAKPNRRGTEINVLELTFSNSGDAKKAEDWIDSSAWSSLVVDYEQSRNTVYMQGVTDPGGNVSPRGPGLQGALKAAGFKFRVTEEDTSDYDEADYDEANEGRIMGISRLNPSYKEGEKAAKKGIKYDKNPYSQSTPGFKRLNWSSGHNAFRATQLSKAGKPNYGARGQFEELDKEDEKSIGDVIKGLKKAVKAHQGQVDALTKDIKDEVAPVARAKAALDVAVAKKSVKAAAAVKQKTKDKADVQRLLDRQKRLRAVARRNEEVVTEAVSDAYVKQIARMTDNNDHFGARIELARMMRDKELMQMYDSLEKMHRMNLGGNDALTLRSKLDKNLKFRLTQKVKKDADRLMGAL